MPRKDRRAWTGTIMVHAMLLGLVADAMAWPHFFPNVLREKRRFIGRAPRGSLDTSLRLKADPAATRLTTSDEALEDVAREWRNELNDVALVVVGGLGREPLMQAAFDTWTSLFQQRIFVTGVPPQRHANISTSLRKLLINVYDGLGTDQEILKSYAHPKHPLFSFIDDPSKRKESPGPGQTAISKELWGELTAHAHSIGWHTSQPKYLLAIKTVQERFPHAAWYILADSDTLIFPHRLLLATRLPARNSSRPLVMGSLHKGRGMELGAFKFPLGGAGIVLSRGAVQKMNISKCIANQREQLAWSVVPADWRIGLCARDSRIKLLDMMYFYQSNAELNCLPNGGPLQECAWGGKYELVSSQCPVTLHYQTAGQMRSQFHRVIMNATQRCMASEPLPWRNRIETCTCYSDDVARNMTHTLIPKRRGRRPHPPVPSEKQLREAAAKITKTWRQAPGPDGPRRLRTELELVFQQDLLQQRFVIRDIIKAIQ